jgi:hypothetical protein
VGNEISRAEGGGDAAGIHKSVSMPRAYAPRTRKEKGGWVTQSNTGHSVVGLAACT